MNHVLFSSPLPSSKLSTGIPKAAATWFAVVRQTGLELRIFCTAERPTPAFCDSSSPVKLQRAIAEINFTLSTTMDFAIFSPRNIVYNDFIAMQGYHNEIILSMALLNVFIAF
jgi:hypothetical protein